MIKFAIACVFAAVLPPSMVVGVGADGDHDEGCSGCTAQVLAYHQVWKIINGQPQWDTGGGNIVTSTDATDNKHVEQNAGAVRAAC